MPSIAAIADLHGGLELEIPDADLLVIAGDVCPVSDHDQDFQAAWLEAEFYPWLGTLPHAEIVWIAGNHDFVCQREGWQPGGRATYLLDSTVKLAGLSIYGTPWIPTLEGWAFYATDDELAERSRAIPEGTDVVVSHGPPRGYGDRTVHGTDAGARALLERLERIEPRLCVFGHIHEDHGTWQLGATQLANVAAVDEHYAPRPGAAMRFELD